MEIEVAIIGAGPIGISLAVRLKQQGVSYVQLEAGQIGSTMSWWAPGTTFFSSSDRISIAGVPLANNEQTKATREEYLNYLRLVVQQYALEVQTHRRVIKIEKENNGFKISHVKSTSGVGGQEEFSRSSVPVADGKVVLAKRVVLAVGNMHKPRMLGIEGEALEHVSHFLEEPHEYFNKRVLIVGGKNSAVEAAIRLQRVGAEVSISYRQEAFNPKRVKFWLLPELKSLIRRNKIKFFPKTTPLRIDEEGVLLANVETGEESRIEAERVLLLIGYEQDRTIFEQLGVNIVGDDKVPSFKLDTMETNVPGLFIAGTAAGGTPVDGVKEFIETSHVHVDRIVNRLLGKAPPNYEEKAESELEN